MAKILKGLKASQYEHPTDRSTLETLKKTPGLGLVANAIQTYAVEKVCRIQHTGSNLKVSQSSYPELHEHLVEACRILDIDKIPELYIQWNYEIGATTVGSENPIIVLNSGVVDLCDEREIMFILGHELGHLKSEHLMYHTMAQVFNMVFDLIPFGDIASKPLEIAIYHWNRMSDLTADRAGLLCCQRKSKAISALMKMAGVPIANHGEMNIDCFLEQANKFEMLDFDNINKLLKLIITADETKPWTVMRASELVKWMNTPEFMQLWNKW